uniref:G protein-coupled receptor n=1 Tax=Parascaris univalens TaxID=6257 RepID=A0A915BIN0_PARUN
MSVALVPISVDRYLKVCRWNASKIKIKTPIPLVCLFVDFFPLFTLLICGLLHIADRITNTLYMVIIPVGSLLIVLVCNIALFISISRHAKVVATFENRRRINETQQLARATCIQAATPLFMQLPSLLGIFSIMGTDLTGSVLIWHLANLIWFLMLLNPLVDAIVTLVVVKAYRRAVRCLLISMVPRKILKSIREERKRSTHAQSTLSLCKGRSQSGVVESRDSGQVSEHCLLEEPHIIRF